MKTTNWPHSKHSQRGGALVVLFALLLPVLIIILGFSVDYANIQRVRTEGQVVSDLCAKGAADTLAKSGGDVALAIQVAKEIALANQIAGQPHELATEDIIFGRAIEQADGTFSFSEAVTPFNSVRVNSIRNDDANSAVRMYFGVFYGQTTFDMAQTATASFRDVEVCLVLDRSVSMKWKTVGNVTKAEKADLKCKIPNPQSRWRALSDAVELFLSELESTPFEERVALVTFASDSVTNCSGISMPASTLDEGLTNDISKIRAGIDNYDNSVWFGRTNITAGLAEAKNHMIANSNPNRDRFIIVLTDGVHSEPNPPFQEATSSAANGITVHTITFGDDAGISDMETIANNGNGTHFHADDNDELKEIFKSLSSSFAIITE